MVSVVVDRERELLKGQSLTPETIESIHHFTFIGNGVAIFVGIDVISVSTNDIFCS